MFRINTLLSALLLAVCCSFNFVYLVDGAPAIPPSLPISSPSSSNSTNAPNSIAQQRKHAKLVDSMARSAHMTPEQLEEVRSLLETYRLSKLSERQRDQKAQEKAGVKPDSELLARVERMRKANAEHPESNADEDRPPVWEVSDQAGASPYLLEGDIVLSVADARRLAAGEELSVLGEGEMPDWWKEMGKKGSKNRLSKKELHAKIQQRVKDNKGKKTNNPNTKSIREKRQAMSPFMFVNNLWPTTDDSDYPYIPFTFSDTIADDVKEMTRRAVAYWNDYTCVFFDENDDLAEDTAGLVYNNPSTGICSSPVGMQSPTANQFVTLSAGSCDSVDTIVHESGHAAGFFHEMVRYDRNDYVKVLNSSIVEGKTHNFNIKTNAENYNFQNKYDFGSVMQYGSNYFGIKDAKGVKAQTQAVYISGVKSAEWDQTLGSTITGPSMTDYKVMNALYKCASFCADSPPITCLQGSFQNPNACDKCVCPPGVGGAQCTVPVESPLDEGHAPDGIPNTCSGGLAPVPSTNGAWLDLTDSIGDASWTEERIDNDVAWCHHYLKAPSGYHLQIEVMAVGGPSSWSGVGCGSGFTEVRVSDSATAPNWAKTGRRACRTADLSAQGGDSLTYSSVGRDAIISNYATRGLRSFTLRYKAVQN